MIGTRIAERYRLDARLGAGGMGSVFRATDERIDRPVAVKLLLPELATDLEAITRFEREARATARITHPGIVQILDFGSVASPLGQGRASYLVMELAEGDTLAHVMARAPLSVPDAIAVGMQVLSALGAAHAAGIVHRDLKPENVMISRGGDGHIHAKLLDFGLAQIKSGSAYTRLTQTGAILGTPRYMSPEQARGESCDARTDVYATGLLLYAALTGRAPIDADNVAAIITAVLDTVPPRLDTVNPAVPLALARAIETAIQKAPAARFDSAQSFAAALDATRMASGSSPITTPDAYAMTAPPPAPTGVVVVRGADPPEARPASEPSVPVAPTRQPFVPPPPPGEEPPVLPPTRSWSRTILASLSLVVAVVGATAFVVLDPLHAFRPLSPTAGIGAPAPSSVPPAPSAVSPGADTEASETTPRADVDDAHPHEHGTHGDRAHASTHLPTSIGAPASEGASTTTPLVAVCRMAVHCCQLVSGLTVACQSTPIGGAEAPPGGDPDVCARVVQTYHESLVAQHRDASECVWPPSGAHALAAPTTTATTGTTPGSPPAPPPHAGVPAQCEMATHCCLRVGGDAESCDRWRSLPADACEQTVASYRRVIEARGEDASDCVWH